jgi:L-alanine-DL-glutamate epimerase-like enolase superfamily enzyme
MANASMTTPLTTSSMTVVRVTSDEGIEGFGFGFGATDLIMNTIKPVIIGRDPMFYEDNWREMYGACSMYNRKGYAILGLSSVDIALWDLRGKMLNMPIHKMLGGSKRRFPMYYTCGWTSFTLDELVEESVLSVNKGYKGIKICVGVDAGTNIREDVRRIAAVRKAVGDDVEIFTDANGMWDASLAIRFAKMAEEYDLAWLEEPVIADDVPGLIKVRNHTSIPIAAGGSEYLRYGVRDFLAANAIDFIQPDVCKAGGFTEYQKISAYAQAWNKRVAPHAWEFLSAHILSNVYGPNLGWCEKVALQDDIFEKTMIDYFVSTDGHFEIPDRPGFGFDIDMDFVIKHDSLR